MYKNKNKWSLGWFALCWSSYSVSEPLSLCIAMETQLRGEASLEGLSNKAVQCQNYLTIIAKLTKLTYSMFLPLQCKKQLVMGLSILQIQLKFLRYAFKCIFKIWQNCLKIKCCIMNFRHIFKVSQNCLNWSIGAP